MSEARKGKEFGARVKAAAFKRCGGPDKPTCEGCGRSLHGHPFQYDHIKPAAEGGPPTLENCMVLCSGPRTSCHSIKTHDQDTPRMVKADNQRKKHHGITPAKTKIASRGFAKADKAKSAGRSALPPRTLYATVKK